MDHGVVLVVVFASVPQIVVSVVHAVCVCMRVVVLRCEQILIVLITEIEDTLHFKIIGPGAVPDLAVGQGRGFVTTVG